MADTIEAITKKLRARTAWARGRSQEMVKVAPDELERLIAIAVTIPPMQRRLDRLAARVREAEQLTQPDSRAS